MPLAYERTQVDTGAADSCRKEYKIRYSELAELRRNTTDIIPNMPLDWEKSKGIRRFSRCLGSLKICCIA